LLKNLIVLSDGTEIFSGEGTVNAIQSVTLTQQVNSGTELTLGSTCANMLQATVITPAGELSVAPGTELTLYKVFEDGTRVKMGLFTTQKTTRPSENLYKITAYDRISRLDQDLTEWLQGLDGWPYSLLEFARMVCQACGLNLTNLSVPNGDWQIKAFFVSDITGRQLMQWVGQACGRFCRATADGDIELAWYTPKDITIAPQGEYPIFGLRYGDYQVAPVDKVQIRLTGTDIGAIYGAGNNAYTVTGNYLLATDSQEALQGVAQVLYEILHLVSYTPCRVTIPCTTNIQAGDIVQLADRNGKSVCIYVMTKTQVGQRDVLECTGNARRDSNFLSNTARALPVFDWGENDFCFHVPVTGITADMVGARFSSTDGTKLLQAAGAQSGLLFIADGGNRSNYYLGVFFGYQKGRKPVAQAICANTLEVSMDSSGTATVGNAQGQPSFVVLPFTYI